MRNLNQQAVLNRVYRHFVIDRQPPGIVNGRIRYHQADDKGNDCPCAIGLFDTDQRLDDSIVADFNCQTLDDLNADFPDLLAEVFGVDALSEADVHFLSDLQILHDHYAARYCGRGKKDPERFVREIADAFEQLAKAYDLKALAF